MGLLSLIGAGLEPVYLGEGIARGSRAAKPSPVRNKSGAPRGVLSRRAVVSFAHAAPRRIVAPQPYVSPKPQQRPSARCHPLCVPLQPNAAFRLSVLR